MKKVRKGSSIPRVLRQPNNGIKEYETKSGEEQMELFAELVENRGGQAVKKLWPKLDVSARRFVMEKLGCFAGPDCPQILYLPDFMRRRAIGVEVRQQIRMVKKHIAAMENAVRRLNELQYRVEFYEQLIPASRSALEMLENIKVVTSRHFGGPYDREIRSIVEAQEFVKRRTTLKGKRVALSLAAVADIFEMNERKRKRPSSRDMAGRLHKALLRFRHGSDYGRYKSEIEDFIRDWKLPDPPVKSGQSEA